MQTEKSSNPVSSETIDQRSAATGESNIFNESPFITSIDSEEDEGRDSVNNKTFEGSEKNSTTGEIALPRYPCNENKTICAEDLHSELKNYCEGPSICTTNPPNAGSMSNQESDANIRNQCTEENIISIISSTKESKAAKPKTAMDTKANAINDSTETAGREIPRKAKSLSFLHGPSPTGIGTADVPFGTTKKRNDSFSKKDPSPNRPRGRESSKTTEKSRRSQTPAAPAISISDYGSDDEIGDDLMEAIYVRSELHEKKRSLKSSQRTTKAQESRSITNPRDRGAKIDGNPTQKLSLIAQSQAQRGFARTRVAFDLPETSSTKDSTRVPPSQCHTPFPRDRIDLLEGDSDSEDSEGVPLECRAPVSLCGGSSKNLDSVQVIDSGGEESLGPARQPSPFWMPRRKEENMESLNVQLPYPSKKVNFLLEPSDAELQNNPSLPRTKSELFNNFVRIGGPRNVLTFERTTETLNVPPNPPTDTRPKLVPGSYCCTCGQNVSHL